MMLINGNVLVKKITEYDYNGIILPYDDEHLNYGIVLNACENSFGVKKGDKVVFPKYIVKIIDYLGQELYVMKYTDILAIL